MICRFTKACPAIFSIKNKGAKKYAKKNTAVAMTPLDGIDGKRHGL
jgi:hypothetical protein